MKPKAKHKRGAKRLIRKGGDIGGVGRAAARAGCCQRPSVEHPVAFPFLTSNMLPGSPVTVFSYPTARRPDGETESGVKTGGRKAAADIDFRDR